MNKNEIDHQVRALEEALREARAGRLRFVQVVAVGHDEVLREASGGVITARQWLDAMYRCAALNFPFMFPSRRRGEKLVVAEA